MLDLDDWPDLKPLNRPHTVPTSSRPKVHVRTAVNVGHRPIQTRSRNLDVSNRRNSCRGCKRRREAAESGSSETDSPPPKRRRLRRNLTTSRLSSSYATPATYVPGRRSLRAGIWARQRVSGRDLLRKAAMLNATSRRRKGSRRRSEGEVAGMGRVLKRREDFERAIQSLSDTPAASKWSSFSEYSVIELEDESSDDEDEDDEDDRPVSIHSDFNKIRDTSHEHGTALEEYSFDSFSPLVGDDIYTFDPGGKALGLILENEKKSEVSHAPSVVTLPRDRVVKQ